MVGRSASGCLQYSCNGGEDEVIFTSVPMDDYEYQIDYSPDPVAICTVVIRRSNLLSDECHCLWPFGPGSTSVRLYPPAEHGQERRAT